MPPAGGVSLGMKGPQGALRIRPGWVRIEACGCTRFNPHTKMLEQAGMTQVDAPQPAFARHTDLRRLMNPGKVRAWDDRVRGVSSGQWC